MIAAANKIECFCLDPGETYAFAGDSSGQLTSIALDTFSVVHVVQAHAGVVQATACHLSEPYIAALSTDRHVSVWRYDSSGALRQVCRISLRAVEPDNDDDDVPCVHSTSQAIGFHDSALRIVTRSANAGLLEVEFTPSGDVKILQCRRLHADADLISARYVTASDAVLSGSIDGQFVLSERGQVIRRWQLGHGNVHWAEHVDGTTYLLASDMRFVARVDIDQDDVAHVGDQFTRDDLEHVTFNQTSGRALVGSFDRNIYEIDPLTCEPTRVAFRAPFKCRWVTGLERQPEKAVVQCRNGGLYKVDIDTGTALAVLLSTPPVLWTCVHEPSGAILLAGDGDKLIELKPAGIDHSSRTLRFDTVERRLVMPDDSYTKRAALNPATGAIVLGRTSGLVYAAERDAARVLADVGSAVRDIAVDGERGWVFVVCEDGSAQKLDANTGEVLARFESHIGQPLWSLAYNCATGLLAVAERQGSLLVLDAKDFSVHVRGIPTARPKRMKWLDQDVLLYNYRDQIRRFDMYTGARDVLLSDVGNTVEDFIWDSSNEYLVFISYTQNLYLADLTTGEIINWVPDQMDYSKGLTWLPRRDCDSYPLDLITFGRSGGAHYFRIHDEKLLALGPV